MDSDYVTEHQKKTITLSTTQLLPWPVLRLQAVHSSQKLWAVNIVSGQTFGSMVSLEVLKGHWSSLRVLEYLLCWIFRSLKSFGWSASGFDSWHYWYKYSDAKSIGTSVLHVHCIAFYPGLLLIMQKILESIPTINLHPKLSWIIDLTEALYKVQCTLGPSCDGHIPWGPGKIWILHKVRWRCVEEIGQVPHNIVPNVSPMIVSSIRALFSTEECKYITTSLLYWFFYIYI